MDILFRIILISKDFPDAADFKDKFSEYRKNPKISDTTKIAVIILK